MTSDRFNCKYCAHCGRQLDRIEASVSVVSLGSGNAPRLVDVCHPDDPALLDCYRLITVYNELVGQRKGGMIHGKSS